MLEKWLNTGYPFRMIIHKKIVVDNKGSPHEVIIPWNEFQQIEEALGLDLEPEVVEQLQRAKRDRQEARDSAYEGLV